MEMFFKENTHTTMGKSEIFWPISITPVHFEAS